jgi:hypothetical protein
MNNPQSDRDEWRRLLNEALLEDGPEELRVKVARAEEAILKRLEALGCDSADQEERLALRDATSVLLALKKSAGPQDWATKRPQKFVPGNTQRKALGNSPRKA